MLDSGDSTQSVLVRGKLNLVAEDHAESNPRRDQEERFALETTGGSYWREAEFPDLHPDPARQGKQPQQGADLMEFRAVHGASILVNASTSVALAARKLVQLKGVLPQDEADDYEAKIKKLRESTVRVWNSRKSTTTSAVNTAVEDVFRSLALTFRAYLDAPKSDADELCAAALALDNGLTGLQALVPAMEQAVGAPRSGDPGALAEHMRTQRSSFMGLAAQLSSLVGVWKVGELHVADLTSGRSKVRMNKANLVTRDAFNDEFNRWLSRQRQSTNN